MKKKLALLLASAMLCTTALSGCSKSSDAPAGGGSQGGSGDTITLTVWSWDVALLQLQEAAKKFQVDHPNVEFNFEEMGTEQVYTKLATSLATGQGLGDIIQLEGEQLSGFATKFPEGFLELSDAVNKDDFLPVKMGEVSVGDKIYGFPWDAGPIALFYRSDYFEQAGVKPEDIVTWDDFIEAGKKVTETCKAPDGSPVKMLPIDPNSTALFRMTMTELGTNFFDADGNTVINSPESIKAMEMTKKIYDSGISLNYNGWSEYEGVVVNESVATIPEAVWMIGTIKDKGPQTAGKWGVMDLPRFTADGEASSTNGGSNLSIPAKSPNAEMAKEFVKFALTDSQLQADGFVNYGLFPSHIPSYENEVFSQADDFFGGQKIYETFIELGKKVPSINYTENFNEAMETGKAVVSRILLEGADVTESLNGLQDELTTKFGK